MTDGAHEGEAEIATTTLAEIYAQQGLVDRALAIYRRLAERSPGDERIASRLAQLELALERRRMGDEPEPFAEAGALEPSPVAESTRMQGPSAPEAFGAPESLAVSADPVRAGRPPAAEPTASEPAFAEPSTHERFAPRPEPASPPSPERAARRPHRATPAPVAEDREFQAWLEKH